MKRNWTKMILVAGVLGSALIGQQYPPQNPQQRPPYQDQNNNGQYDNGQYPNDSGNDGYYDDNDQGIYAPAPPPMPSYAYQQPPMPGPGYFWVDGYWNFLGGRYVWVGGYWMRPPHAGGYWIAPRYTGGRYFVGFWSGGARNFNHGYVRNNYGYQARTQSFRPEYRAPGPGFRPQPQGRPEFRGNENRGIHEQHGGRR